MLRTIRNINTATLALDSSEVALPWRYSTV
jgi:hypothetical protein